MAIYLKSQTKSVQAKIAISGSKSETNRLLILKALFPELKLKSPSNSDDSKVLSEALSSDQKNINIGHAGTAMRFLTAYYAFNADEKILTGSKRMQNRPIKILVNALRELGAEIDYLEREGFPPIHIKGQKPTKNNIKIKANISSQYISALLLIAPKFHQGLKIHLQGKILSKPYIEMTLALLNKIGVKTIFTENIIQVFPINKIHSQTLQIESDWSSASYFYSLIALANSGSIQLSSFQKDSLQGDKVVVEIYKSFGINTIFKNGFVHLTKKDSFTPPEALNLDLSNHPDLAQTIIVTCLGLKIPCHLTGLENLKIKETDRLQALKNELEKFDAQISISQSSIRLIPPEKLKQNVMVKTYDDHRMAMAFAPLAIKTGVTIEHPEVVSKSYPNFWEDFKHCLNL